jgi:hypothetical protein
MRACIGFIGSESKPLWLSLDDEEGCSISGGLPQNSMRV